MKAFRRPSIHAAVLCFGMVAVSEGAEASKIVQTFTNPIVETGADPWVKQW